MSAGDRQVTLVGDGADAYAALPRLVCPLVLSRIIFDVVRDLSTFICFAFGRPLLNLAGSYG